MITEFIKAAKTEVENHSIYVWGGSGQLCADVTENWIRTKERGRMPQAAVNEWVDVMNSPYRDVARCFDCSGYVSWCLKQAGAFNGRTDCDGLYARCEEIYSPIDGCLLFRTNPANHNDETHVGIYYDGLQYHAKGRATGVIAEKYNPSFWQRLAWFKALKPDEPQPAPEPPEPLPGIDKVKVVGKSVNVRTSDSTKGRILFTAHRGDEFLYRDTAPSGWYEIETKKGLGFITNKKRYTVLIDG